MNTQNYEPINPVSVRKMYLDRRAVLIRQNFESNRENLTTFVSQVCSEDFNATRDEALFAKCLEWMHQNLQTMASVKSLSADLKISVRKIQRLFTFFAQKTYTTVLLEMRLSTAKKHLAEMKNNIGEVGHMVGIRDHAYFTYLFRRHTGVTPSQFRLEFLSVKMD